MLVGGCPNHHGDDMVVGCSFLEFCEFCGACALGHFTHDRWCFRTAGDYGENSTNSSTVARRVFSHAA